MAANEPVDVWSLADLETPWCLRVAATLRIADRLAAGPLEIAALASASGAHAETLQRVLRHVVSKGVFVEPAPGRFALNDAARALAAPPIRLGLDLDGFGGRMAHAWSTLRSAVRTGEAAYHERFGAPFWDDLRAHPDVAADFDALMGPAGHGTPDPDVLIGGDWGSVRTVLDVGGGTGALLAEILRAHPELHGTLVDQPATVARAAETFASAGVASRATAVGGSFFDPLPRADLVLLKNVLADWPDREAASLLRRCAEASRPDGRVVVLGGVFPDEAGPPPPALLMLVLVGGKERTLAEFRELARAAGLRVQSAARVPSGRFAVECRPESAATSTTSPRTSERRSA